MFDSDIDSIYDNILNGNLLPESVEIISSKTPQSINILKDFPNVKEILCPIISSSDSFDTICTLIMSNRSLIKVSLIVYVPIAETSCSHRPYKRRRIIQLSPYQKLLKITIPNFIRKIGPRMKYISLAMMIMDDNDVNHTVISIDHGYYHIHSNENNHHGASNIFDSLISNIKLVGISTNGTIEYNLDKCPPIPDITIVLPDDINTLNASYLSKLISTAENLTVVNDSPSFESIIACSQLILSSNPRSIKQLKCIVPIIHVNDHICYNENLEEIHILVSNSDDIEQIKYIMLKYSNRAISYFLHYITYNDNWSFLKNYGDVIFCDISIASLFA